MMDKAVFVFGSNLAGIHGAGAAAYAHTVMGAQWGVGEGRTGNAYALPTKDAQIHTLPLEAVRASIRRFCDHAREHPCDTFLVTPVGTGLAGLSYTFIFAAFREARIPSNCVLSSTWITDWR